jgi:hypothetical protein
VNNWVTTDKLNNVHAWHLQSSNPKTFKKIHNKSITSIIELKHAGVFASASLD